MTISFAESCTGGFLSSGLTDVPGASDVFTGGVVSYSNEWKESLLGVKKKTLKEYGAVSENTAREMVQGLALLADADISISVTGIAGPGGGTVEKPVGTVFIGFFQKGMDIDVVNLHLRDLSRIEFKEKVQQEVLDILLRLLDKGQ